MFSLKRYINQSSLYVGSNIIVSCVGFIRSFVFMYWLNMEDLGLVSLTLVGMQFLSFLQLGFFNGGFRFLCYESNDNKKDANNLVFSYLLIVSGITIGAYVSINFCHIELALSSELLLIAIFGGLLMLVQNWLTNALIAERKLLFINLLNIISVSVSILFLPTVYFWGLKGALLTTIIQPFIFVMVSLIKLPELRPSAFNFRYELIKKILSIGFIPFLSGIFVMINLQVERWTIAEILGAEALGRFYLISLYVTLSLLIPNSINNIFFPKLINAYENKDYIYFKQLVKKDILVFIVYVVIIIIGTIMLLKPVVSYMFPNHINNLIYVYYYLPGIVLNTMTYVSTLVLNASLKLKAILYTELIASMTYMLILFLLNLFDCFNLVTVCIARNILYFLIFIIYLIYTLLKWDSLFSVKRS